MNSKDEQEQNLNAQGTGRSLSMPIQDKEDFLLTQQLLDITKMLQQRELNRAREALQPLLSRHSKDYRLWHLAGIIASMSGKQEQAEIYLKQTHQLAPQQIEPLLNLARVYVLEAKYSLAASCYLKVLEINRHNEAALYGLTTLLIQAARYEKAEEILNQWLIIRENIRAYQLLVQVKIAQRQYDKALELYKKMLALEPNNINIKLQLANFYTLIGDYPEAIERYQHILDENKNNLDAQKQLAFTYYLNSDFELAQALFEQVLQKIPNDFASLNNLSCVYKDLGDYERAETILLKIIDSGKINAGIYANLAGICMYQKKYNEAEKYYKTGIALEENAIPILQLYAGCLLRQGKYSEGWPVFTKAYVSLDRYGVDLPLWDGKEDETLHLLLIADGKPKDIVLLSRLLDDVVDKVNKVYLYHQDENIREWLAKYFPNVKLIDNLQDLPKKITQYSSLLSLPELLSLQEYDIVRHRSYINCKIKPKKQTIFIALNSIILAKPEYQCWIESLLTEYKKVYVFSTPIDALDERIQFIKPQENLIELTKIVAGMENIISSDNIVAHLAGALTKVCTVVVEPGMEWYWPIEGKPSVWYPHSTLILFPQEDFR